MFEGFTDRARRATALANQEAQRLGHGCIGPEHILLGLVREGGGVGASVIKSFDIELSKVRSEAEKLTKRGPDIPQHKLPQTPGTKRVIKYAIQESRAMKHRRVGTEHILLGLLRDEQGVAYQMLVNLRLSYDQALKGIIERLSQGADDSTGAESGVADLQ